MTERSIEDRAEADELEQSQPIVPEPARAVDDPERVDPQDPEADVLEQRTELPIDDEEPR